MQRAQDAGLFLLRAVRVQFVQTILKVHYRRGGIHLAGGQITLSKLVQRSALLRHPNSLIVLYFFAFHGSVLIVFPNPFAVLQANAPHRQHRVNHRLNAVISQGGGPQFHITKAGHVIGLLELRIGHQLDQQQNVVLIRISRALVTKRRRIHRRRSHRRLANHPLAGVHALHPAINLQITLLPLVPKSQAKFPYQWKHVDQMLAEEFAQSHVVPTGQFEHALISQGQ